MSLTWRSSDGCHGRRTRNCNCSHSRIWSLVGQLMNLLISVLCIWTKLVELPYGLSMMPAETRIDSHRRVEILRFTLDFLKSRFFYYLKPVYRSSDFELMQPIVGPLVEWIMCGACCTRLTAYLVSFWLKTQLKSGDDQWFVFCFSRLCRMNSTENSVTSDFDLTDVNYFERFLCRVTWYFVCFYI